MNARIVQSSSFAYACHFTFKPHAITQRTLHFNVLQTRTTTPSQKSPHHRTTFESSSGSLLIGYATWSSAIRCRAMHTLDYRWAYVVNADNTLSIRWYKLSMWSKRSVYVTNTLCIRPTRYEYAKNFLKTSIVQCTPAFYIHFHTLANMSRCDRALSQWKKHRNELVHSTKRGVFIYNNNRGGEHTEQSYPKIKM